MASTWYNKKIGDSIEAYNQTLRIQESFLPEFRSLNYPLDMAVYSRFDHVNKTVTVYSSPATHNLAKAFDASACDTPSLEKLILIAGVSLSNFVLFENES